MSIKFQNKYPQNQEEKSCMKQPFASDKCPKSVQLQAGKIYWYCGCGLSKSSPFCDGSHKGSPFGPKKFNVSTNQITWICQCRQSKTKPFCDGTHKQLEF